MKNKLLKSWFILLLVCVIFHCTITFAYNSPITPFKEKYVNLINAYMTPLFSQAWTLFAPNPVSTNVNIEVKISYGKNQESNWVSISELIQSKSNENYFSHYQFYLNSLIQMQNDTLAASESIMNKLEQDEKEKLKNEIHNDIDKKNSNYINGLVEEGEIEGFLQENPTVNSLYGLVYDYFNEWNNFSNISNMQIRISSEIFPEYGKNDGLEYNLFYLPKIETDYLVRGELI